MISSLLVEDTNRGSETPRGEEIVDVITTGEAARILNIQHYQLKYAIETGKVPEPRRTIMGARRYYTRQDVEEIRRILKSDGEKQRR